MAEEHQLIIHLNNGNTDSYKFKTMTDIETTRTAIMRDIATIGALMVMVGGDKLVSYPLASIAKLEFTGMEWKSKPISVLDVDLI
jgi:GTP cyclohydrolase III